MNHNILSLYPDFVSAKIFRNYFLYESRIYPYFIHRYQWTQYNERAIEIPIFQEFLSRYPDSSVLEVGNVLSHYLRTNHTIVDKYESGPGVINSDIIDFNPDEKYNLILSISTFEHIGKDENEKDPDKSVRAFNHLKSLLSPGGMIVLSIPLGWNPDIDQHIEKGSFNFDFIRCMKRDDTGQWSNRPYSKVQGSKYLLNPWPFQTATGLIVGYYEH
jgi:hypothetical protein